MEELSLQTLIAVFEEMFGVEIFWAMIGVSALAALLFLWVVIRDRGIRARRFTRAELLAPVVVEWAPSARERCPLSRVSAIFSESRVHSNKTNIESLREQRAPGTNR